MAALFSFVFFLGLFLWRKLLFLSCSRCLSLGFRFRLCFGFCLALPLSFVALTLLLSCQLLLYACFISSSSLAFSSSTKQLVKSYTGFHVVFKYITFQVCIHSYFKKSPSCPTTEYWAPSDKVSVSLVRSGLS